MNRSQSQSLFQKCGPPKLYECLLAAATKDAERSSQAHAKTLLENIRGQHYSTLQVQNAVEEWKKKSS